MATFLNTWPIWLPAVLVPALAGAVAMGMVWRRRLTRSLGELQQARRNTDAVLTSITDNVTFLDPDFHVIWTNWRDREHGAPECDITAGSPCHMLLRGKTEPCTGCPVPAVMRTGLPAEGEVHCLAGRILRMSAAPVRDAGGELEGVVQISRDITEKRHLAERLQQAQKMQAVGQLAAGVAHDFNNSLQVILGYADLLQSLVPDSGEQTTYLDAVCRAGEQARDVVRQLLTFSRKHEPRTEPVDLAGILEERLDVLRRLAGAGIDIRLAAPADLPLVTADPSQVDQVLLNLCVNARDAMPGGGRLDLELETVLLDATAAGRRGAPAAGDYVVLTVRDTGEGIPPELQRRVFDPFFTTKDVDRGSGLGLATVYGIVAAHHGFIELESAVGQGATFRIGWPASSMLTGTAETVVEMPARTARASILVVEDDPGVRKLAVKVLEREGHDVEVAVDGRAALDVLVEGPPRHDLVVMDVMLPGANGWAVYLSAVARRPDLKVIFCSGHSPKQLESEVQMEMSGMEFLQKPYRPVDLVARVRRLLAGDDLECGRQEG